MRERPALLEALARRVRQAEALAAALEGLTAAALRDGGPSRGAALGRALAEAGRVLAAVRDG